MHNPVDGMTLWQRVERHLVTEGPNGTFSMRMPKWQKLEAGSADAILSRIPRSDPESDRRNRMMLDLSLIRPPALAGKLTQHLHQRRELGVAGDVAGGLQILR